MIDSSGGHMEMIDRPFTENTASRTDKPKKDPTGAQERLSETREITPYLWVHPDEER